VDVFCSEAFFGGSYSPLLKLHNKEIAELMRYVASLKRCNLDLRAVKSDKRYLDVMRSGVLAEGNEWLLDSAVRQMHKAASDKPHRPELTNYIVRGGKIAYQLEGRDEFSTEWSYHYETNAAYLYEFGRGRITEAELMSELAIHVSCGEFSYARLPKAFKHILGVTGTLDEKKLPPQMHDTLKRDLAIEHFTYCPSMYHTHKRGWEPAAEGYVQLATSEDEHFHLLVDEIQSRLKPNKDVDDQRSVLIYLRDDAMINRFRDSAYFDKYRNMAGVLTEVTAATREEYEKLVKDATRQGMVTLAKPCFGRGTDFKIFDDRMEDCGGMHVILGYYPRSLSELVQIMGRCARQGNRGSFSMVLELCALVREFDLKPETVQAWPAAEIFDKLSAVREALEIKEVQSLRELAMKRKEAHNGVVSALRAFQDGSACEMGKLMKRYNSHDSQTVGENGLHVIVCLDDSYSMSGQRWKEAVHAFRAFWKELAADQMVSKHVSVIIFNSEVRLAHEMAPVSGSPLELQFKGGQTAFAPPVFAASQLIAQHGPDQGYTAVVVFMSDGVAGDAGNATQELENLAVAHGSHFASYTVGFGSGASRTLESMAFANGAQESRNYSTANVGNLASAFSKVASTIAPGRSPG